jgi:hypothetical protein
MRKMITALMRKIQPPSIRRDTKTMTMMIKSTDS